MSFKLRIWRMLGDLVSQFKKMVVKWVTKSTQMHNTDFDNYCKVEQGITRLVCFKEGRVIIGCMGSLSGLQGMLKSNPPTFKLIMNEWLFECYHCRDSNPCDTKSIANFNIAWLSGNSRPLYWHDKSTIAKFFALNWTFPLDFVITRLPRSLHRKAGHLELHLIRKVHLKLQLQRFIL